jgi:outer membrane protein TolC
MRFVRVSSRRAALLASMLVLALASVDPRPARAADAVPALPSPLKPDDVLVYARAHRAEITAAKAKASAAAETPKVVSALPDPMVMASVDHLPFMLKGVDWSVQVQQDFPLGGTLGAKGRAAEAEARAVSADALKVQLDVEYSALGAYLMWLELQRMAVVIDEQLATARQVFAVTKVRLSVSSGMAADVVRAEVDVAKLEGERKAIDSELASARSMLNATLGRAIDAELPSPELAVPAGAPPASAELAKTAIEKRPELVAMKARVDKAGADVDVMKSMYAPMAFIRGGYSQTMADGPGVMLMVGVSIPIWREKLSSGVSEATSMKSMAEADVAAMTKMIEGEVGAAREQVVAARVRLQTVREKVLPLAKQALSLTLASYGAGQVPLVSVLEATQLVRDSRLEEVIAEVKLAVAWARLGRSIGVVKVGV